MSELLRFIIENAYMTKINDEEIMQEVLNVGNSDARISVYGRQLILWKNI